MKSLVVTADDFGASVEVNEAVEQAHRNGILTCASLMVGAAAAEQAVAQARRLPSLRVGLHLVLVDGRPMLPATAVHQLVDENGAFRSDMGILGAQIWFSRRARQQLEAEITAQFEAFEATGLNLDHCNAHKHFHLHPTVGAMMLKIGRRFGLRAVRVPLEPRHILASIEPHTSRLSAFLTDPFARLLRRRADEAGVMAPDQVFGLRWSGSFTRQRLAGLICNLPDGLSEIYLHPATAPFAGSALGYRYDEELAALVDPEVIAACRHNSLRLGGFSDFLKYSQTAACMAPARQVPSGSISH